MFISPKPSPKPYMFMNFTLLTTKLRHGLELPSKGEMLRPRVLQKPMSKPRSLNYWSFGKTQKLYRFGLPFFRNGDAASVKEPPKLLEAPKLPLLRPGTAHVDPCYVNFGICGFALGLEGGDD